MEGRGGKRNSCGNGSLKGICMTIMESMAVESGVSKTLDGFRFSLDLAS